MKRTAFLLYAIIITACHQPIDYRIMTFNIRTSDADDGPNGWVHRAHAVVEVVHSLQPDLAGLQEVEDDQYDLLQHAFGADYDLIRYRTDVVMVRRSLDPQSADVIGISATRAALRVQLPYGTTFVTTHVGGSRAELELLRDALPTERTILVGDFNALPGDNPWGVEPLQSVFTGDGVWHDVYADTHPDIATRSPSGCGWRDCDNLVGIDARIDWLLVTSDVKSLSAVTIHKKTITDGNVSDHWPVFGNVCVP